MISLYLGWMLIMVMFNFGVLAVYQAGISHSFFVIIFWVLTFLVLVGISVLTSSRKVFMGVKCLIGIWIGAGWALTDDDLDSG